MSEQYLSFKDASLNPMNLIDVGGDPDDTDVQWFEYCRIAATVNRQYILDCVLSDLDAEDSPLYDFIDDAITNPHEPGRPKANITDLARVGKAILSLVAQAVDHAVGLRLAVGED